VLRYVAVCCSVYKTEKNHPRTCGGSHVTYEQRMAHMNECMCVCVCVCVYETKKKPPSEHIESRRFGLFRNTSVRDTSDIPDAISGDSSGNRKEARDSSGKEELWSQSELY